MKHNQLFISFIVVSVVSLITSSVAVFASARAYSELIDDTVDAIFSNTTSQNPHPTVSEDAETSTVDDELSASLIPNTTSAHSPESSTPIEDGTDDPVRPSTTEGVDDGTSRSDQTTSPSSPEHTGVLLRLDGNTLKILERGAPVYERSFDCSSLKKSELEKLRLGLSFPDYKGAMDAVYDLIS